MLMAVVAQMLMVVAQKMLMEVVALKMLMEVVAQMLVVLAHMLISAGIFQQL